MHNIVHLTTLQIVIGVALVLGVLYIAWFFERYPKWWTRLEDMSPMFRFGDSRPKPTAGPPRVEFGARPRDPSDFMISRGVSALAQLELLDTEEVGDMISPMEAKVLVQMVWAEMWQAWAEERKEQFYDHMEGA